LLNQWLTCCPACINFIITLYQMLLEFMTDVDNKILTATTRERTRS
jgi:coenzyme F420-reducing hydrogenase gamma subunit